MEPSTNYDWLINYDWLKKWNLSCWFQLLIQFFYSLLELLHCHLCTYRCIFIIIHTKSTDEKVFWRIINCYSVRKDSQYKLQISAIKQWQRHQSEYASQPSLNKDKAKSKLVSYVNLTLLYWTVLATACSRGSSEQVKHWACTEEIKIKYNLVHFGGQNTCTHFKPVTWGRGYHPRKEFENIGAGLCNLVTSGHQKWDGKSMLFHPTFKSGMEFSIPAIQVPPRRAIAEIC